MDDKALQVAMAAANWNFWSMIFAAISAVAAVATALVAFFASRSWRKQERLGQMVRIKRAAFEYRAQIEKIGTMQQYGLPFREFINNELKTSRGNVFHELALAGLDDDGCEQGRLYNQLFSMQELYKEKEASWKVFFEAAVKFQQSIEVKI